MWIQTMDWMWAFMKATLIPWFIFRIGVRFLNHTLFPSPSSPHRVRRTKCYNTHRSMDRRRLWLTYIKEMMECIGVTRVMNQTPSPVFSSDSRDENLSFRGSFARLVLLLPSHLVRDHQREKTDTVVRATNSSKTKRSNIELT
jgi:hypothetical protein